MSALLAVMAVTTIAAIAYCFTMLSERLKLALLLSLGPLQIFPPGLNLFGLSLGLVLCLATLPWSLPTAIRVLPRGILFASLLLLAVRVLYIPFSDDPQIGLRAVVELLGWMGAAGLTYKVLSDRGPDGLQPSINVLRWILLCQSLAVVLFRLSPPLELRYWSSPFVDFLAGANTSATVRGGQFSNNIFDPLKSGGLLFGNANTVVLMTLAVSALLLVADTRTSSRVIAGVAIGSIFFTGSKFAAIATVLLVLLAVWRRSTVLVRAGMSLLALALCVAATRTQQFGGSTTAYGAQVFSTAETRTQIWNFALVKFLESPILGQGFGGWQSSLAKGSAGFNIPVNFPPHNYLLYSWSQTGLLGGLATLALLLLLASLCLRCLSQLGSAWSGNAGIVSLPVLVALAQGLGENSSVYGEVRSLTALGACIGFILWRRTRPMQPSADLLSVHKQVTP